MRSLPELKADCSRCAALCCMALPFDKGEDFALDKPALHPCPHLDAHRCTIHAALTERGFRGCTLYDCLGAGQRVTQEVFAGADWQRDASLRAPMAEALGILRRVHAGIELLEASESLALPPALAPAIAEERAALRAAYHPDADWTLQRLTDFAASALPQRLQAFLLSLRPHV